MIVFEYILSISLLLLTKTAYAANEIGLDPKKQPGGVKISNNPGGDLAKVFKNSINILFAVGAMAFTIMIIWGAVDWILSGGDKEKIASGRRRITNAIIGLVILSLSFTIMVVVGQVLSINALQFGDFKIPGLGTPIK